MQDLLDALPARYRPLRRLGLMPCCGASVLASKRVTRPGSELQCRVCQAIYVVDVAGCWCFHGKLTTLTPTSQHHQNRMSRT